MQLDSSIPMIFQVNKVSTGYAPYVVFPLYNFFLHISHFFMHILQIFCAYLAFFLAPVRLGYTEEHYLLYYKVDFSLISVTLCISDARIGNELVNADTVKVFLIYFITYMRFPFDFFFRV